jgi:nitrite reductase (NADH) small subunit
MFRQLIIGRPNGIRRKVASTVWNMLSTYLEQDPENISSTEDEMQKDPFDESRESEQIKEPPKDITPPEGFEVVLHTETLKEDEVTQVIIAGTAIAIARNKDGFFAIENTCPHAGGPMSDGWLNGSQISCPYHGWSFNLHDGSCTTNPEECLKTYEVQVIDEAVCVKM